MSNPIASETQPKKCKCGHPFATTVTDDFKPEGCTPNMCQFQPASDPSGKGAAYEWLLSNSRNEDPEFLKPTAKLLEQFTASLRQQLSDSQAELKQWSSWGIVEIAIRNQSVSDYVKHWEGRTLVAEGKVSQLEAKLKDIEWFGDHSICNQVTVRTIRRIATSGKRIEWEISSSGGNGNES